MDTALLQSATVADAMGSFETVPPSMSMTAAAELIRSHRGRALVVYSDDSPAIFTEFDIVKVVAAGDTLEGKTVGDHHTRIAIAATPDWSLDRAMHTMMRGQFRHLVVVDNGATVGMLAMRDILDIIIPEESEVPEIDPGVTVEFSAHVPASSSRMLHNLRRSAKQHLVAAKCDCELDWIEILIGQAEERDDISDAELEVLWDQRPLCPTLHAMGGGGD